MPFARRQLAATKRNAFRGTPLYGRVIRSDTRSGGGEVPRRRQVERAALRGDRHGAF